MNRAQRGRGLTGAVILGASFLAIAGFGQEGAGGGGKSTSAYSWGPYTAEGTVLSERTLERFGWPVGPCVLQPYAEAMAVYDDNIFLNSAGRESEFYTVFTPGAMLLYGNPRHSYLYLDYSADFTTLDAGDSDTFDGQSLTAGLHQEGARSQVNLAHRYREVRDVDTQVGARLKRKSNTTTAGIDGRVAAKTSVGLLGSHTLNQFDDPAYADNRETMAGGRVSWQVRPRTSLFGQATHGWIDVDEDRDAFGSGQYDEVAVGVNGHPRPRLQSVGQVGVQHRYFESDTLDDITREVASLKISGQPLELFQAWLGLSAGLHPAINAPGFTVFDTRVEPGISRRLFSERVIGALSALWGRGDYLGKPDPGTTRDDPRVYDGREDRYWGWSASVDWWVGRYWSIGAGYSYLNNDSDADGRLVDGRLTDSSSYDVGRWMIKASFNR